MTQQEFIKKAQEFLKDTELICWTPIDFAEDMEDSDALDNIINEGSRMYDAIKSIQSLIKEFIKDK